MSPVSNRRSYAPQALEADADPVARAAEGAGAGLLRAADRVEALLRRDPGALAELGGRAAFTADVPLTRLQLCLWAMYVELRAASPMSERLPSPAHGLEMYVDALRGAFDARRSDTERARAAAALRSLRAEFASRGRNR